MSDLTKRIGKIKIQFDLDGECEAAKTLQEAANLIEQLQQRNGELEKLTKSQRKLEAQLQGEINHLESERDELAASVERLREVLTDKVIDLVRCGIGSNYGGKHYDNAIAKYYEPLLAARIATPQANLAEHDAELLKGFSFFLRDKHKIYVLPLAEQYANTKYPIGGE